MLSFQGPRSPYKDSVTLWPSSYLGFSGAGVGWEIITVGLHLAAPELSAESMFHSALGKPRRSSRFGDQYQWVCALFTVMEAVLCGCEHAGENEFLSCGRARNPQFLAVFLNSLYLSLIICKMGFLEEGLGSHASGIRHIVQHIPGHLSFPWVLFLLQHGQGDSPIGFLLSDP